MHRRTNRQSHVLVFAGTGEGPALVAALADADWSVSVSVVTESAAQVYRFADLKDLHVGAFRSLEDLGDHCLIHAVDAVVDATHPFALTISAQLQQMCRMHALPLVRFERPGENEDRASLIGEVQALAHQPLQGHRVLLALGARHLAAATQAGRDAGAIVKARVLPTPAAIRLAGAAGLCGEDLAVLRPLSGLRPGAVEAALCRRWAITDVLCRQSGGAADALWTALGASLGFHLWKVKRPSPPETVPVAQSTQELLTCLDGRRFSSGAGRPGP